MLAKFSSLNHFKSHLNAALYLAFKTTTMSMPNEVKAIIDNCTITSYDASIAFFFKNVKKLIKCFLFTQFLDASTHRPYPG